MKRKAVIIERLIRPNVKEPYGYIYITTNLINQKQYVGQHFGKEIDQNYYGSGVLLLKAIDKYGKENFISEPIDWAESKEELDQKEIWWIDFLGAKRGITWYNVSPGGTGYSAGENHLMYGTTHSEEWRTNQSRRMSGEFNPNYQAKTFTEETREKLRKISLGRTTSEETKQKLSEINSGKGNPMSGYVWSEEQRKHMSEVKIGKKTKPHTEETKKKISSANKGKRRSDECVEQMRLRNLGEKAVKATPVVQLSLTGEFIKRYSYIKGVAIETDNLFKPNQISACCKHYIKSYKGYIWMYEQEYLSMRKEV